MTRKLISVSAFGLIGAAILIALGIWQVQRLAWKQDILALIEAQIADAPVALPEAPDSARDLYLAVTVTGRFDATPPVRVLVSQKGAGAGYRLISVLDTGARRVLVDRGFLPTAQDSLPPPTGLVTVTGNLNWPDDRNSATPQNDLKAGIWFARDIPDLAAHFDSEPILVIARNLTPAETGITPLPVDTSAIPNDHLSYAVTWFSLAAIWLGMTGYLLWRIRQASL